jgi:hypothetical protein
MQANKTASELVQASPAVDALSSRPELQQLVEIWPSTVTQGEGLATLALFKSFKASARCSHNIHPPSLCPDWPQHARLLHGEFQARMTAIKSLNRFTYLHLPYVKFVIVGTFCSCEHMHSVGTVQWN